MPDSLAAAILGALQGLTEFLPISSSGHLVLAHEVLGFDVANSLTFDLALHLGTLLALLSFFWNDIVRLSRAFSTSLFSKSRSPDERLVWLLILAVIPAALIGAFLEPFLEGFRTPMVVIVTLVAVGSLFLFTERVAQHRRGLAGLPWYAALVIGLGQALALVPGVSRSGITIVAGMHAGLSREDAARFTFLLSIPTVAGAAFKKMLDLRGSALPSSELSAMVIGIATAAVVGYAVIRFLMRYLVNHKLNVFAYYRIALAAVALLAISLQS